VGRKRELADPKKVTLLLHREDYEAMKGFYPIATAAVAIRALVHQHVEALRARAAAKANEAPLVLELDLEEKDV
jgi:hypothetical protein